MRCRRRVWGKITGMIYWAKSSSDTGSYDPCSGFLIQATTVNGYQNGGDFVAPSTKVGNAASAAGSLVGNTYQCSYTLTELPVGAQLQVTATTQKAPSGTYASFAPAFVKVALSGPAPGNLQSRVLTNSSTTTSTTHAGGSSVMVNPNLPPAGITYGANAASNVNFELHWMQVPH